MIMGLFGSSRTSKAEWRETQARWAREDAERKATRRQQRAHDRQFGRRGHGIVCGWAVSDKYGADEFGRIR
jgi:hypothetical protein